MLLTCHELFLHCLLEEILDHNTIPLLQEPELLFLIQIMLVVSYGTQLQQTYEDRLVYTIALHYKVLTLVSGK